MERVPLRPFSVLVGRHLESNSLVTLRLGVLETFAGKTGATRSSFPPPPYSGSGNN